MIFHGSKSVYWEKNCIGAGLDFTYWNSLMFFSKCVFCQFFSLVQIPSQEGCLKVIGKTRESGSSRFGLTSQTGEG